MWIDAETVKWFTLRGLRRITEMQINAMCVENLYMRLGGAEKFHKFIGSLAKIKSWREET